MFLYSKKLLLCLFVLFIPANSFAIPALLTHQGHVVDSSDTPLAGVSDVIFSIYTQPTGGSPIWSENLAVTFNNGSYSVNLGAEDPLSANMFDTSVLYLGVALSGTTEFEPREKITSVP